MATNGEMEHESSNKRKERSDSEASNDDDIRRSPQCSRLRTVTNFEDLKDLVGQLRQLAVKQETQQQLNETVDGHNALVNAVHTNIIHLIRSYEDNENIQSNLLSEFYEIRTYLTKLDTKIDGRDGQMRSFASVTGSPINSRKLSGDSLKITLSKPSITCIVKSKNQDENSTSTLKEFEKAIKPKTLNIGIARTQKLSRGTIVVTCKSSEDRDKLLANVNSDGNLVAEKEKMRNPLVIFKGLPQDQWNVEKLKSELVPQNGWIAGINLIKFKFSKRSWENGKSDVVFEVDGKAWQKLTREGRIYYDHNCVRVLDFSPVTQCLGCLKFGHTAAHCDANQLPPKCFKCGEGHKAKECKSDSIKCINCVEHSHKFTNSPKVNTNHSAKDRKCPAYQRILKNLTSRTDYGY